MQKLFQFSMKTAFFLIVFLICQQFAAAQVKLDEYQTRDSDYESAQMDNLAIQLQQQPESKAVIAIYRGSGYEKIGNILKQIEGIKAYLINSRGLAPERILFSIKEGGKRFFKELWIYPKDAELPRLHSVNLDLSQLTTKFLYASACLDCGPAVPTLFANWFNLESYANLLKQYPNHKGLIIIYPNADERRKRIDRYESALSSVIDYRNQLTKKYQINPKQISIRVSPPKHKESVEFAEFFIVPKRKK